jgi:hypothetical protein
MRASRAGIGWLFVTALVGFACDSGGEDVRFGEPNAVMFIPESDVPAVLAKAQCDAQMACECLTLTGPVGEDPEAYTRAQCIEHRELELAFWQEGAAYNDLVFDSACLARKLERLNDLGCGGFTEAALLDEGATCQDSCRVYHGDLKRGDPCVDFEVDRCGQGLRCVYDYDYTTDQSNSTCQPSCVPEGANCEQAWCEPGTVCSQYFCTRAPQVGQACLDWACDVGAMCDPQTEICVALTPTGASCTDPDFGCPYGCIDGTCDGGPPTVCYWDFRDQSY